MYKLKKIIRLFRSGWFELIKDLKKEYHYVFSLSFKEYLFELFFPKRRSFFFQVFRILILFPFFRFFFDCFIFIFFILFNIYFLIFDKIFFIWNRILIILLEHGLFLDFFLKISNFFRYFILFMFFVNIKMDLKKKRIPLWLYITEFFFDVFIKIFRRQIKFRNVFKPIVKFFEIIIVFFHCIGSLLSLLFNIFLVPIWRFFSYHFFLKLRYKLYYYKHMFLFNHSGAFLTVDNITIVKMSLMLQKNGFIAPTCSNIFRRLKAYYFCQKYRYIYIYSELRPERVNLRTADIHVYLFDLFKDTVHKRNNFGYLDILRCKVPYAYIMSVYFFLIDFFRGIKYLCYIFLLPVVFFIVFCLGLYLVYIRIYFYYCMCFKDFNITIKIKIRDNRVKKVKRYINNMYLFILNIFKYLWFIFSFPFKKIYEKIFW